MNNPDGLAGRGFVLGCLILVLGIFGMNDRMALGQVVEQAADRAAGQAADRAADRAHSPVSVSRMTPELIWKLGRLGSVALDRDGTRLAYTVRHFDLQENRGRSSLHLKNLVTGDSQVLLQDWKSINSLYWVAAGEEERLWFDGIAPAEEVSAADGPVKEGQEGPTGKNQVYFLSAGSGDPVRATSYEEGVSNFKISPCGSRLAFSRRIKMNPTVDEIYPDLPKANARIIDELMYRHWDSWHDFKYSHLHVAELGQDGIAGEPLDLLDGIRADSPVPPFGGTEQFDWSPDGKELAFTMKDVPDWAQSTNSDVYLIPMGETVAASNISETNPGYDNNPLYSPDGKWLVYNSMERAGFEADRNRLMLMDRTTGSVLELSAGLDQNINHPVWLPDSSGLVFDSDWSGAVQLFRIDLDGNVRQLTDGPFNWQVVAVAPDGKSLVAKRMSMLYPQDLFLVPLVAADGNEGGDVQRLTEINREHYQGLELPLIEQRWVEASDGKSIHCWVIYPPGFDPSSDRKWPLLTYCQGGPQSQVSQFFSYRWNFHLMAAHDYIVVAVNRRGLPGFGQQWNDQISGDWGGQAMRDLLSATDSMTAEPYVDEKRVAAVGASFGGFSVYWMMGNAEDRFCTMISHCGVFNLESMYGSTEELFFVDHDLGGPYWKSPQIQQQYDQFSPHRFVGQWKTPLLVIHGEKDFRVPITQGMEAFTAAKVQGVPARFLYFPEEGHWVMSPQNGVLWNRVFFEWLDRFCKPN